MVLIFLRFFNQNLYEADYTLQQFADSNVYVPYHIFIML